MAQQAEKKNPARFNLKFDPNKPLHADAIAYLQKQGRKRMSEYIAKAILFYERMAVSQETAPAATAHRSIKRPSRENVPVRIKQEGAAPSPAQANNSDHSSADAPTVTNTVVLADANDMLASLAAFGNS